MSSYFTFPRDKPFDVVGLGLNAVDQICVVPDFPEPGSKTPILEFTRQGGGQVATAAVCLSRFGLRVKYLGKVGDDDIGAFSVASLRDAGVDVTDVVVVPGEASQFAFILVPLQTGERTIIWRRGPGLVFKEDEFGRDAIVQGRLLHLDTHEVPMSIVAARYAREAGMPVLLDAERVRERTPELVSLCDVVLADERFGRDFTGETDPRRVLESLSCLTGARIVGLTVGARGSMALADGEFVSAPGYPVAVVDTTGAGDVYHAAFGYGLLRAWPLERVCRFSNTVAALKCRRLGGRAGIPTLREVEALMGESLDPETEECRVERLPAHPLVQDAFYFSREVHRGQTRDHGTPYFPHPYRAAVSLVEELGLSDPEAVAAALLHDSLEDSALPPPYLESRFGPRVRRMVETLTKPANVPRDERDRLYFGGLEHADADVLLVKVADRLDNLRQLPLSPKAGKLERYVDETRRHYLPLARRAGPQAARLLEAEIEHLRTPRDC